MALMDKMVPCQMITISMRVYSMKMHRVIFFLKLQIKYLYFIFNICIFSKLKNIDFFQSNLTFASQKQINLSVSQWNETRKKHLCIKLIIAKIFSNLNDKKNLKEKTKQKCLFGRSQQQKFSKFKFDSWIVLTLTVIHFEIVHLLHK